MLRRFNRKRLLLILLALLFLLAAINFGVAWHYSSVLNDLALQVRESQIDYDLTATATDDHLVKLENGPDDSDWRSPGKWGLRWLGPDGTTGNGMLGDIIEHGDNFVIRRFTLADGDPPHSTPASVSGNIYPNDPYLAFGIQYQTVQYQAPLGMQDAWQFAQHPEVNADTWAIFVHGLRSNPAAGLPILPVLNELNIPALFITYRNDKNQPQDPSGVYQYGLTEWQDLHAAVEYALSQPGAKDIVLIGQSMGGGIVAKFLYESPLASSVTGVVLDSPMMHFEETVRLGARQRNLPFFITDTAKWLFTLRFGLDWDSMDYLKDAHLLNVPILLIHGEDDASVPIRTSNTLAQLRPDLITYATYPNTTHANTWNTNSTRHNQDLRDFLLRVAQPLRHSREGGNPRPGPSGQGVGPRNLPTSPSFPRRRESTARTERARGGAPKPNHLPVIPAEAGIHGPDRVGQGWSPRNQPPAPSFPRRRESTALTEWARGGAPETNPPPRHSRGGGNPRPGPSGQGVEPPKPNPRPVTPAKA